jgi:hypothetical protein
VAFGMSLVACNTAPLSPAPPGVPAPPGQAPTAIKVTAPELLSPVSDVRLQDRRPVFMFSPAVGQFTERVFAHRVTVRTMSGTEVHSETLPGGETRYALSFDLDRDTQYQWSVQAIEDSAVGPLAPFATFMTVREFRTPDPPRGQRLPLPDGRWAVFEIAARFPAALANSCQPNRGTWEFMDRVVDRLRETDTRWGYNCKRGNCGDPSHDVVTYHHGAGPDEGSPDVYAVDVIVGHCGATPAPAWVDITGVGGSPAAWTSRGRF